MFSNDFVIVVCLSRNLSRSLYETIVFLIKLRHLTTVFERNAYVHNVYTLQLQMLYLHVCSTNVFEITQVEETLRRVASNTLELNIFFNFVIRRMV